jgi:hypothetical protein
MKATRSIAVAGLAAYVVLLPMAAPAAAQHHPDHDHHKQHHRHDRSDHPDHPGHHHHQYPHDHYESGSAQPHVHPDPRPGVSADDVASVPFYRFRLARTYRMAGEVAHVLDGIRCPCRCSEDRGHYSLLTCFGENKLARYCGACRDAAQLAHALHLEGKDLDEIRAGIDAAFQRVHH